MNDHSITIIFIQIIDRKQTMIIENDIRNPVLDFIIRLTIGI